MQTTLVKQIGVVSTTQGVHSEQSSSLEFLNYCYIEVMTLSIGRVVILFNNFLMTILCLP